jgi:hypothetical protein
LSRAYPGLRYREIGLIYLAVVNVNNSLVKLYENGKRGYEKDIMPSR